MTANAGRVGLLRGGSKRRRPHRSPRPRSSRRDRAGEVSSQTFARGSRARAGRSDVLPVEARGRRPSRSAVWRACWIGRELAVGAQRVGDLLGALLLRLDLGELLGLAVDLVASSARARARTAARRRARRGRCRRRRDRLAPAPPRAAPCRWSSGIRFTGLTSSPRRAPGRWRRSACAPSTPSSAPGCTSIWPMLRASTGMPSSCSKSVLRPAIAMPGPAITAALDARSVGHRRVVVLDREANLVGDPAGAVLAAPRAPPR